MSERLPATQDKATGTQSGGAAAQAPPPKDATMLPPRRERRAFESAFVRLIATSGVVGIGVAIGAIMTANDADGWMVGLVVAVVAVVLSAILWSSRKL